jgi:hypothetical protein
MKVNMACLISLLEQTLKNTFGECMFNQPVTSATIQPEKRLGGQSKEP